MMTRVLTNLRARAHSRTSVVLVALMVMLSFAATPGAAMRHLKLLKSSPSADTTLTTSPDAIRLWLSEAVELPATKIQLETAAGMTVTLAALTSAATKNAPVVAAIPTPLAPGAYKVTWKAMSKDGHVVNGVFGFTVGTKP
ncbi:MAG: copper resistance protein CopC [Gemmatimonadaceae bacterium]|nr:copper resistance protein CopC [Gemmatimonadaceae bacterium]